MKRYLMLAAGWLSLALGCVGVFVPVLPTTPFVLLAAFLFARSSERVHRWLCKTKVYRTYVVPFKQDGGITRGKKARILAVSLTMLAISAFFVRKPVVWIILSCVAVFLLWLMFVRIPTVADDCASPCVLEASEE